MDELPPLWLQPASNTLTTLVLYQSSYFGYAPKLDLRGVHFPNLRTLAFGNYTFTHDVSSFIIFLVRSLTLPVATRLAVQP